MRLTQEHLGLIAKWLPTPRKPPKDTLNFLNAVLYAVENGGKWAQCACGTCFARRKQRPARVAVRVWEVVLGSAFAALWQKWTTLIFRFNRWCKNGTLNRVFEGLKEAGVIDITPELFCLDSMTVCVHPDGAGALHASGEQSLGRSKGG